MIEITSQVPRRQISFTSMYMISRDDSGVILICLECPHIEGVSMFDGNLGSRRTQAAQAMLKHTQKEHFKLSGKVSRLWMPRLLLALVDPPDDELAQGEVCSGPV